MTGRACAAILLSAESTVRAVTEWMKGERMPRKKSLKGRMSARKIKELAFYAGQCCLEKKANDVIILDLKKISQITDYFVIAEGYTDIHVRAVSGHLEEQIQKKYDVKPWHVEGI